MARPSSPMISRELAIKTTLELIDEEGYETFSLSKLARRMGVRTPSLYYYFAGRDEVLTEAARELLLEGPVPPPPVPGEWQEWFVELCMETYRLIMRHPRAAGLVFTYFPNTVVMPSHERGALLLAEAGVPVEDQWAVMRGMEKLVFGMAFGDAQDQVSGRASAPHGGQRELYPAFSAASDASPVGAELLERAIRVFLAGVDLDAAEARTSPGRRKAKT
jgi:TetR/AcrR family transcriptional regulator, tetracycline repressor protein